MIFVVHSKNCCLLQEAAIEEYFKPIDKEVETIVKIQLDGEEKTMKEMMTTMQRQAMLEKMETEKIANMRQPDADQSNQDATTSSSSQHAEMR